MTSSVALSLLTCPIGYATEEVKNQLTALLLKNFDPEICALTWILGTLSVAHSAEDDSQARSVYRIKPPRPRAEPGPSPAIQYGTS